MKNVAVVLGVCLLLCASVASASTYGTWTYDFNSDTVGSAPSTSQWVEWGGTTNVVTGGIGGTNGLGVSGGGYCGWLAHSFTWANLGVGDMVKIAVDMQAASSGQYFDDDRIGWLVTSGTSGTSQYLFSTQVDTAEGTGPVETYWRSSYGGGTTVYNNLISSLGTITGSGWYQYEEDVTKLTDTSAKINVYFTPIDSNGNATGTTLHGTMADTSVGTNACPSGYFTNAPMIPMLKNFNVSGVDDNYTFSIVQAPEPSTIALLLAGLGGLALNYWRRKRA